MAQPQMMQIKLSRFDAQPWGFRLQGGTDFAQPLLVQKVNGGSLAEKAGLMPGDAVIKINDVDVFNLRHKDAQDIVVRSGNNFVMTVQRGGSTWRPHVQLTGNVPHPNAGNLHTVTKTSLAHKQQEVQHIGSGYNNSARPFGGSAVDGNVKSIVNKQYNTPVGIYSDESIAETLSAQAEVLAGGVLGVNFKKNEKEYQADKSEVLKFLREEESGTSTPEPPSATSYYATKSHAIGGNELRSPQTEERITAKFQKPTTTQAPPPSAPAPSKVEIPVPTEPEQPDPRLIVMPVCPALQTPEYKEEMEKAAAAAADGDQPKPYTASGHPACSMCGVGIVGVFVRIKDKNLHVECFKCATCGTNLKNQGYYNFNNKLYCDIHAKLAALQNPPPGTEGYVPVPIKPNTKLSASTISSALNTHGYNNGVSNGSSTPTPAPAADMNLNDLPLPPPPSPTQLQQYEQDQGNVTNISNIPPPPPHTRTLSSLSSMSSGSNTTHSSTHSLSPTPYQYQHQGQGPCNNVIMQTHNITMDPYASTSPMHSRQTSSSSSSLNYASDNNYMTSPPPPPPPPLPLPSMLPPAAEDNRNGDLYIDTMKQQQNAIGSNNSSKLLTNRNNENDKNSYNKSGNGNGIGVGNGTTFQPNTHKVAPTAVTGPTSTITTTKSPSSSNIPIVDKSLINSNNTYNPESNTTTTTTTFNTGTNDMSSTMASSGPSVQPTSETSSNGVGGDKPFEYVTLTGNVIRSVVPPGKGTNVNYKVNNQGYARPYGAPPAAAPKSPVTFPPQTQQWNAPPPTQPKPSAPAGNPYATLPRSNVGQGQESLTKSQMLNDTLPRISNANPKINASANVAGSAAIATNTAALKQTDLATNNDDDPTAMLSASISKINMDNQMNNFMAEAGKVISNMLEARLANCGGGPSTHSGSSLSLRSNSSSNLSRSPMVVRKRLDLDDFKDINPTEPASLKPVVAVQQNVELKPVAHSESNSLMVKGPYTNELSANHPMGKVLDICDNGKFKPSSSPLAKRANAVESVNPPPPPAGSNGNLPPSETVIYRNNDRSNRRASHAIDRRSYIETNGQTELAKDGPVFSINVKALGKEGTDPNKPMSPENEEVVSQLLKDGKRPICCQCNNEITSGPFITALGKIWCPEHFHCTNGNCRRPLQDIGFVEEKGDLYCEYCFEKYLAPGCSKCGGKIKGDCLNAIGKHFHPECFSCGHCGKLFGNTPFFLEDGMPYCEADWNELFTTKCFACGFPVEAGDRWVEALNHNYHSQCFNCTYCKQNLEGQSFYNKGGRPFCKNHAR
ncbi:Z band alternatively spliced PDZ-motif protein 52 isoform X13 [Haematobia irritans]|uniref:Z band alternatively spliced PDZ-motif protein 52 isoform X13 n=1 Tax=Haematobia irritans TaxID=7368 RepID=UPI003F5025BB